MAEKEVRKTTAKKAVRRTTTKVAPRKTPVRKTATAVSTTRKAPARATVAPLPRKKSKVPLIFLLVLIIVIGASIAIGYTDKGPIDVTSIITTRKQNATPEEQERFKTVPVQQGQTGAVNGGLVGTGKPSPLVPSEPQPQTATSSDTVATSSEAVAEETSTEPESEEIPVAQ